MGPEGGAGLPARGRGAACAVRAPLKGTARTVRARGGAPAGWHREGAACRRVFGTVGRVRGRGGREGKGVERGTGSVRFDRAYSLWRGHIS